MLPSLWNFVSQSLWAVLSTVHDIQGQEAWADLYVASALKIQTEKSSSNKELILNA